MTKWIFCAIVALISFQPMQAQEKLTLEKVWASGEFYGEGVQSVNPMEDGAHYTILEADGGGSINKYSYKSGKKVATLLSAADLKFDGKSITFSDYKFNKGETSVLLSTESEAIYRRSSKGNFYVYNLSSKKLQPIADFSLGKQSHATFSPDGKHVAFVRENNLFYYTLANGKETAVTNDGKWNEIIYGMCDWVYEEEFGFTQAFQWSPDSKRIGFYRFDESEVPEFQMAFYGQLYPEQYSFKYPKAGEKNSDVSIHIYDIASAQTEMLNVGPEKDQYIARIFWASGTQLCATRLNRLQNKLDLLLFTAGQPDVSKTIYTEQNNTYVEINDDLRFLADGSFIITSEKDGYNHIYHYDINGKLLAQATKGDWDVAEVCGVNEKTKTVFYISTEASPLVQEVYSVSLNGSKKTRISPAGGYNRPAFSEDFSYFINNHSDINTPGTIALYSGKGKLIRTLKDNAKLKAKLKDYGYINKEFLTIKNHLGFDLNAWMLKPANFDANKKYPVYLTFYGGPGANEVKDTWGGTGAMWHQYLAQQGYLVIAADPRGTMYRGASFKKSTYGQLGKLETEDMIDVAKWIKTLPYANGDKIACQGWSFGGYLTSLLMTKGAEYFKAGIAVAPVTNWRFYDTIYTERYMGLPKDNATGYDDNSPINHVEKLKGAYLVIHGSGDDNVHYQNTMEMVDALVSKNKPFDMFIYPNKNHGIYGGYTRLHLFTKMFNFLNQNL